VFAHRHARAVALGIAGPLVAAASAGTALALTGTAVAPYAQAAVTVADDGSIVRAKGVDQVTRPAIGVYCVRVSAPGVTVAGSIHTVASRTGGLAPFTSTVPEATCDDDPRSIRVIMVDRQGDFADGGFSLAVH
jgi:hypothetical protein